MTTHMAGQDNTTRGGESTNVVPVRSRTLKILERLEMLAIRMEKTLTDTLDAIAAVTAASNALVTAVTDHAASVAALTQRIANLPTVPGEIPPQELESIRADASQINAEVTALGNLTSEVGTLASGSTEAQPSAEVPPAEPAPETPPTAS